MIEYPFYALALVACACGAKSDDSSKALDARVTGPAQIDAMSLAEDAAREDASSQTIDAGPAPDAQIAMVDAASPPPSPPHVHIYISNSCQVSTVPTAVTLLTGNTQGIIWHNHSTDYEADVWMTYGGGFLQLAKGGTWNEPAFWCGGTSTGLDGSADVGPAGVSSSSCPHARVPIVCE